MTIEDEFDLLVLNKCLTDENEKLKKRINELESVINEKAGYATKEEVAHWLECGQGELCFKDSDDKTHIVTSMNEYDAYNDGSHPFETVKVRSFSDYANDLPWHTPTSDYVRIQ